MRVTLSLAPTLARSPAFRLAPHGPVAIPQSARRLRRISHNTSSQIRRTCADGTAHQCTVCSSGFFIYMTSCLAQCPDNFWGELIHYTCQPCNAACQRCVVVADYCQSCKTGYFLYNYQCGTTCPNGYYKSLTQNSCNKCDSACNDILLILPGARGFSAFQVKGAADRARSRMLMPIPRPPTNR